MAWYGQPLLIEELLFKTEHGLVDQSLHSRMGAETTKGDGFGIGWGLRTQARRRGEHAATPAPAVAASLVRLTPRVASSDLYFDCGPLGELVDDDHRQREHCQRPERVGRNVEHRLDRHE